MLVRDSSQVRPMMAAVGRKVAEARCHDHLRDSDDNSRRRPCKFVAVAVVVVVVVVGNSSVIAIVFCAGDFCAKNPAWSFDR